MPNRRNGGSGVKQRIVELHEAGRTILEIAEVVNLSESRVHGILSNRGRTRSDRGGAAAKAQRAEDLARVRRWMKEDVPERTMAQRLERSRTYVQTLKIELGDESEPELERDQEIVRLFLEKGMSQIDIGNKFDLSHSRVSQIIRRAGYTEEDQRRAGGHWTPDEEIRRLYEEEGLSLRGVAKAVEMSKSGVRDRLLAMGVELRRSGARITHPKRVKELEDRDHEIVIKHLVGAPLGQLAEEHDLSYERIRQIVRAGTREAIKSDMVRAAQRR